MQNYKFGLSMRLPEGKLPGFYAQIIKAIAGKVSLWDRDKELLILNNEEERATIKDVLNHYKVYHEEMDVWLLPDNAVKYRNYEDYGFESKQGYAYLYADKVALYRVLPLFHLTEMDTKPCLLQLEENLIVSFHAEPGDIYYVDVDHKEWVNRIAAAYGHSVTWL
ncbi:hypothetical protein [Paenibacillus swuensis]|nr:hypothetical protein [Paenibacillus swuensis]